MLLSPGQMYSMSLYRSTTCQPHTPNHRDEELEKGSEHALYGFTLEPDWQQQLTICFDQEGEMDSAKSLFKSVR